MKIHRFVINLLAALLLAPPLHAAEKPSMPNIVVILADDLGYGDVSCYNDRAKVPTPNLDRLAREGMRFTDAHSPATVCTPSRYSLMTGQMAFRVPRGGMVFEAVGGPSLIAPGRLNLPGMLRAKGYATACVGKWHVGLTFFDHDGQSIRGHGVEADHPNAQPRPARDGRPRLQQRLHAGRAEWRDVCALPSHVALRADVVSYR